MGGVDLNYAPLTLSEAFYMATKGGGKFFGKVGSFEKGCELDALSLMIHYYLILMNAL